MQTWSFGSLPRPPGMSHTAALSRCRPRHDRPRLYLGFLRLMRIPMLSSSRRYILVILSFLAGLDLGPALTFEAARATVGSIHSRTRNPIQVAASECSAFQAGPKTKCRKAKRSLRNAPPKFAPSDETIAPSRDASPTIKIVGTSLGLSSVPQYGYVDKIELQENGQVLSLIGWIAPPPGSAADLYRRDLGLHWLSSGCSYVGPCGSPRCDAEEGRHISKFWLCDPTTASKAARRAA